MDIKYLENEEIEKKVISALIYRPEMLLSSEINLSVSHFRIRKYKILFGVLDHLIRGGLQQIQEDDIFGYLKQYPTQLSAVTMDNGVETVREMVEEQNENFFFYYKTIQKISLINALILNKFDVSEFYNPSETDPIKKEKINKVFEEATPETILSKYEVMVSEARSIFVQKSGRKTIQAGHKLRDLKNSYQETPKMGYTTASLKINTITKGRLREKFHLYSAPTSVGKTRIAISDATKVSCSAYYDWELKEWVKNGVSEPTLYITTEINEKDIQTLFLANISGVPQSTIENGMYSFEQNKVLDEAIEVIENSPLYIDYISSFSIEDIESSIKKFKQQYGVNIVFFDYIHLGMEVSGALSKKMGLTGTREDIILKAFSSKLKDLAQTYDIHIHSATQTSSDWEKKEVPNQNLISGSKAIADKVDVGAIMLRPTPQEEQIIEDMAKRFAYKPNLVLHFYKNRLSEYKDTKVFIYFDYSTCRTYDCFTTDIKNRLISIPDTIIK